MFGARSFRIGDFGCGNAHLYGFFKEHGLACEYFGFDFSTSLLAAARERYAGDGLAHFIEADIEDHQLDEVQCDIVLYSHVLEMLQSPQQSLMAARHAAPVIMVRFFEPPVGEYDVAAVRQLETGGPERVPYIRRTMSRDYWNLLLSKIDCQSVEVHQVDGDKDQIHILRFADDRRTVDGL
jgi:SAM-dependent methyltransferase